MWLFVLSVMAIGCVQSASVGYGYQTLSSYNSNAQVQNPINSGSLHGYLSYLDNNAAKVGNKNPQPVYAVHQIKYTNSPAPTPLTVNKYDDVSKIREACIRTVTFQQYINLKRDIDLIRSQGKLPSADNIQKLKILEKIAFTSDFSLIADLPEVKLIIQDLNENINRLYNDSIQSTFVQQSNIQQSPGEINTYNSNLKIGFETVEETAEQRQAREEHLRIYNEQIAHLKQLELEHEKYVKEKDASLKSVSPQLQEQDNAKALAELEQARQEHFRLWNEAKLRAEQAISEDSEKFISTEVNLKNQAVKQEIDSKFAIPTARPQSAIDSSSTFIYKSEVPSSTVDTPEVVKAREEHLRLVEEANVKAEQQESKYKHDTQASGFKSQQEHSQHIHPYVAQIVQETPEVVQAREEHLRLVEEAKRKAQLAEQQDSKYKYESQATVSKSQHQHSQFPHPHVAQIVQETPEVIQAREEHLRLVHEANVKAQLAEQHDSKYKHASQALALKSQHQHTQFTHPNVAQIVQETPEVVKAREEHLRLVHEANVKAQLAEQQESKYKHESQGLKSQHEHSQITHPHVAQIVQETPEVIQAREEHLRLVHEANVKAHLAEQQESKYKPESQALKSQHEHSQFIHSNVAQIVQETPEVLKAREEHLRLVHEASVKAQLAEQQESKYKHESQAFKSQYEQSQHIHPNVGQIVQDTPEVVQAREEHFRLVQEAKQKAELAEQQTSNQNKQEAPNVVQAREEHLRQVKENLAEKRIIFPSQEQAQYVNGQIVEETPEVVQARKEHLRIYDAIKSHVKNEHNKVQQVKSVADVELQQESLEEKAFLELERIREIERLQNEKQQLEMDRVSEIERLAEEKQQMEAELMRLKLEDEQRLEMEHLLEAKRLQEEQEKHKGDEYQVVVLPQHQIKNIQQSQSYEIVDVSGQEQAKIQQAKIVPDIEYSFQEESALLKLERIRELERLQKEKEQLDRDRLRDIVRLAEEKQQMEAELIRLKLDDEQRSEMERLSEAKRLQEEQEELKTQISELKIVPVQLATTINQHSVLSSSTQQPQASHLPRVEPLIKNIEQGKQIVQITGQYSNNPFLKLGYVSSGSSNNLVLPIGHQIHQESNIAVQTNDNTVPGVRRVPSSHYSSGNKHQHIHDENLKPNKYYPNIASPQPADTAVALSALERATNEHFRAHERALEQLRLARLQNSPAKDCN